MAKVLFNVRSEDGWGDRMSRYIDADAYFNLIVNAKSAMFCIDKLHSMPTADVVPVKHGHWERIPNTPTWKCSICGYEITGFIDRDGLTPIDCKVNYCSRCGSLMDEVTE